MEKTKEELIEKYIEANSLVNGASIKYFAETGKVSGGLFASTTKAMGKYAQQPTVTDEEIDKMFPLKEMSSTMDYSFNVHQRNKREGAKALRDKYFK